MGRTAVAIALTEGERRELEGLASRRKTAQGLAQRARIVLLAAEGAENKDISLRVNVAPNTVGKWRRRFAEHRLAGLLDEPRPGAPRQIGDDEVAEVIRQTLETAPSGATHWSLRSMAKAAGLGLSVILCVRLISSLSDEPFAEDNGELGLGLEPLTRRPFPFLGRVVENEI